MEIKYDSCTKEKDKISYYVYNLLLDLGFNPSSKGTIIFRDLIIYIYQNDLEFFNINSVYNSIAQKYSLSSENVCQRIVYSINNLNTKKLKSNFQTIFNLEYDLYYLSVKKLSVLIKNKLDRNF